MRQDAQVDSCTASVDLPEYFSRFHWRRSVCGSFWCKRKESDIGAGWTFVVTFALFYLAHARSYYTMALYPMLLAAGSVVFGRWLDGLRPWPGPVRRRTAMGGIIGWRRGVHAVAGAGSADWIAPLARDQQVARSVPGRNRLARIGGERSKSVRVAARGRNGREPGF